MIHKHKDIFVVVHWMTSAFVAESCQGDRRQGQQSVLKTAKITIEVHSVGHDMWAVMNYSVRLRKISGDVQILPQQFFRE
jgi:hypothetical protein